jgi:hypothetical protein
MMATGILERKKADLNSMSLFEGVPLTARNAAFQAVQWLSVENRY